MHGTGVNMKGLLHRSEPYLGEVILEQPVKHETLAGYGWSSCGDVSTYSQDQVQPLYTIGEAPSQITEHKYGACPMWPHAW